MKWGLKGGISIDVDSGPLRYVYFDAVGSRIQEEFTFMQIGSGHTVGGARFFCLFFVKQSSKACLWEPVSDIN